MSEACLAKLAPFFPFVVASVLFDTTIHFHALDGLLAHNLTQLPIVPPLLHLCVLAMAGPSPMLVFAVAGLDRLALSEPCEATKALTQITVLAARIVADNWVVITMVASGVLASSLVPLPI